MASAISNRTCISHKENFRINYNFPVAAPWTLICKPNVVCFKIYHYICFFDQGSKLIGYLLVKGLDADRR